MLNGLLIYLAFACIPQSHVLSSTCRNEPRPATMPDSERSLKYQTNVF